MLFISGNLSAQTNGGRLLSETNLNILKCLTNLDVSVISLGRTKSGYIDVDSTKNTLTTGLMNLQLYSGGLNRSALIGIVDQIAKFEPDILYLDTSLYGRIALEVRKRFKKLKIITFFHNVEFDFKYHYKSGWQRLLYLPAIISDWVNERWAINNSDVVVALHQSDSSRLKELYCRSADFLHPVCLTDDFVGNNFADDNLQLLPDKYLLFVGSAFLPNIEALRFLVRKVMPELPDHLVVVGSNLENYRREFAAENVSIIGSVRSLAPYYSGAKCVLAPIFTGGGMKVKIADALMHGKCVIGSGFSFIGYEKILDSGVCMRCESVDDFIEAVRNFRPSPHLERTARKIFLEEFSFDAGRKRLEFIVSEMINS